MTIPRYRIGRIEVGAAGHKAVSLVEDENGEAVSFTDYEREVAKLKGLLREYKRIHISLYVGPHDSCDLCKRTDEITGGAA